jgi:AraC-like DNA-binding protein
MLTYTRHAGGDTLPTHRHIEGYAALVVEGVYTEMSLDGPMACRPGTVVLHPPFHAHGNRFGARGARVVNMPLPRPCDEANRLALSTAELREARRILERHPGRWREVLGEAREEGFVDLPDWQRAFVDALRGSDAPLGAIAREIGISAAHASRALRESHGMTPQALRRESRWRRALALLPGDLPLAEVALHAGFADQCHLTRISRAFTGLAPGALRRRIKCVQDARGRLVRQ